MQYTIYIDVLFLKIFILSFILLLSTGLWNKVQLKLWKIIMGALVWSLLTVSCLFLPSGLRLIGSLLMQGLLAVIVMHPVFGKNSWKECVPILVSFTVITLYYSGSFRLLNVLHPFFGKIGGEILVFALAFVLLLFAIKKGREKNYVTVCLLVGEEIVEINALVDTGNTLVEPFSKKAVCVLERECLPADWIPKEPECRPGIFMIPYRAVGTKEGLLPGVCFKNVKVKSEEKEFVHREMMIAFCNQKLSVNGKYRMLLHEEYRRG